MEKKITYFSQAKQDLLFSLLFPGKNRFFVDVGARDGMFISNTYILEKDYGWSGICIEPHPSLFKMLEKNRQTKCLNVAVADVDESQETLEFAMWKEGPLGHSGILGIDYRHTDKLKNYEHEIIKAKCLPLKKILSNECIRRVDVLDIDVEGAEASVLRSIDFTKCHFNLISIETGNLEIEEILSAKGFRFLCNLGEDIVYRNDTQIPP